jgi:DNA-binding protein HU-beta
MEFASHFSLLRKMNRKTVGDETLEKVAQTRTGIQGNSKSGPGAPNFIEVWSIKDLTSFEFELKYKGFGELPTRRGGRELNKADLVAEVAKVLDTKKMAEDAVSCVFETITKALKKGQTMTLVGFGTFRVGRRKARMGRNPQTGAEIKIPAKKIPKFSPGKALKSAVK